MLYSNKKIIRRISIIMIVLPILVVAQEVKVVTYNIKYDKINDTINNWNDRKDAMVLLLKKYDPGFIGMQEVLLNQLEFLDKALPNYDYIGVGRDDGKQKGEFSPILYNSEKYTLLQSNTFWLSKNPDKISVGWDAAMERICTYGLFEDKISRQKFWVFNTHFDHIGIKARKKSVKLIHKKIKQINAEQAPVVLMGDFNLLPEEKPIQYLKRKMKDALTVSQNPQNGPKGTFNGFNVSEAITRRIDYIFVKGFEVTDYQHIDERLTNGKHISDHQPVIAHLILKN